jgi:hypothetical protein
VTTIYITKRKLALLTCSYRLAAYPRHQVRDRITITARKVNSVHSAQKRWHLERPVGTRQQHRNNG